MNFRTFIERHFVYMPDADLLALGVSVETRRRWKDFIAEYRAKDPAARIEEVAEAYFVAHPEERPIGELTIAEFREKIREEVADLLTGVGMIRAELRDILIAGAKKTTGGSVY